MFYLTIEDYIKRIRYLQNQSWVFGFFFDGTNCVELNNGSNSFVTEANFSLQSGSQHSSTKYIENPGGSLRSVSGGIFPRITSAPAFSGGSTNKINSIHLAGYIPDLTSDYSYVAFFEDADNQLDFYFDSSTNKIHCTGEMNATTIFDLSGTITESGWHSIDLVWLENDPATNYNAYFALFIDGVRVDTEALTSTNAAESLLSLAPTQIRFFNSGAGTSSISDNQYISHVYYKKGIMNLAAGDSGNPGYPAWYPANESAWQTLIGTTIFDGGYWSVTRSDDSESSSLFGGEFPYNKNYQTQVGEFNLVTARENVLYSYEPQLFSTFNVALVGSGSPNFSADVRIWFSLFDPVSGLETSMFPTDIYVESGKNITISEQLNNARYASYFPLFSVIKFYAERQSDGNWYYLDEFNANRGDLDSTTLSLGNLGETLTDACLNVSQFPVLNECTSERLLSTNVTTAAIGTGNYETVTDTIGDEINATATTYIAFYDPFTRSWGRLNNIDTVVYNNSTNVGVTVTVGDNYQSILNNQTAYWSLWYLDGALIKFGGYGSFGLFTDADGDSDANELSGLNFAVSVASVAGEVDFLYAINEYEVTDDTSERWPDPCVHVTEHYDVAYYAVFKDSPNKVIYSRQFNPLRISDNNSIFVGDRDIITGIYGNFNEEIVVTKKKQFWVLRGTLAGALIPDKISDHRGNVAPQSGKEVDRLFVCLDEEAPIAYDGTLILLIGEPIRNEMDNFTLSQKENATAVVDQKRGLYILEINNTYYCWSFREYLTNQIICWTKIVPDTANGPVNELLDSIAIGSFILEGTAHTNFTTFVSGPSSSSVSYNITTTQITGKLGRSNIFNYERLFISPVDSQNITFGYKTPNGSSRNNVFALTSGDQDLGFKIGERSKYIQLTVSGSGLSGTIDGFEINYSFLGVR